MHEPWRHYAKWNKPNTIGQILYNFTYIEISIIVKFTKTESSMVVNRGLGETGMEIMGTVHFQFGMIKSFGDRGNNCITMRIT